MPRPRRLLSSWLSTSLACGFLCAGACKSSEAEADSAASAGEANAQRPMCVAFGLRNADEVLATIDAAQRPRATAAGVYEACQGILPPSYAAMLSFARASTGEGAALWATRDEGREALESRVCPDHAAVLAEAAGAPDLLRRKVIFDGCDLEAQGLAASPAALPPDASLMPYALQQVMLDSGLDERQARRLAMSLQDFEREALRPVQVMPGQTLCEVEAAPALPGAATRLFVNLQGFSLEGRRFEGRRPGGDEKASSAPVKIEALAEVLSPLAARASSLRGEAASLVLVADARVTAEHLADVVFTARGAGFGRVELAVRVPDPAQNHGWGALALSQAEAPEAGESEARPRVRVHVGPAGYLVRGDDAAPEVLPAAAAKPQGQASPWPTAALLEALRGRPDLAGIDLSADPSVPTSALAHTLAVFDHLTCGPDPARSCIHRVEFANAAAEGFEHPLGAEADWGVLPTPGVIEGAGQGPTGGIVADRPSEIPKLQVGQAVVGTPALDKEVIRRVIRSHQAEVKRCYEAQLIKDPELAGKVEMRFTVDGEGKVSQVGVKASTLGSAAVEACLVTAMKGWTFPSPRNQVPVQVVYPFIFQPG